MHNEDQYILSRLIMLEGELAKAKDQYEEAEYRYDLWSHKRYAQDEYSNAQSAYRQALAFCREELKDRTLHHDIDVKDFPNLYKLLTIIKIK